MKNACPNHAIWKKSRSRSQPALYLTALTADPVQDIEALARATDDALALIPSGKRRACDVKRLEALQRKLDDAIDEVGAAFVRLNYLSPKDRMEKKTLGVSWIIDIHR